MKKIYILLSLLLTVIAFSATAKFNANQIKKLKLDNANIYKAYLLADNQGHVLYKDESEKVLPIASLTKLMTAMVVLDHEKNLNKYITVTKDIAKIPFGAHLKVGEKYTIKQLLYIMLVRSTNSAAKLLANTVSKSNFENLMNAKAKSIGARTARFCTPNGLPPRYTGKCMDVASARDIYKISRYAINYYPVIRQIVSTEDIKIKKLNLKNTNTLLGLSRNIVGIKTGYHNEAEFNISVLYSIKGKKYYEIILGSDSPVDREKLSLSVLKQLGGK